MKLVSEAPGHSVGLGAALTPYELLIVRHIVDGLEDAEIADLRKRSYQTIKTHVKSCLRKTGSRNRTQLAVHALRTGLAS